MSDDLNDVVRGQHDVPAIGGARRSHTGLQRCGRIGPRRQRRRPTRRAGRGINDKHAAPVLGDGLAALHHRFDENLVC
jgi:hypothetical protein